MRVLVAQVGGSSLRMKAIVCPSGEKCGEVSAALVAQSLRIFPLATSTSEMSAVGQSLAAVDFEWQKTMVLPSGDQSKPLAVSPKILWSPGVNSLGGRLPSAF